jgi:hypothetical protein
VKPFLSNFSTCDLTLQWPDKGWSSIALAILPPRPWSRSGQLSSVPNGARGFLRDRVLLLQSLARRCRFVERSRCRHSLSRFSYLVRLLTTLTSISKTIGAFGLSWELGCEFKLTTGCAYFVVPLVNRVRLLQYQVPLLGSFPFAKLAYVT